MLQTLIYNLGHRAEGVTRMIARNDTCPEQGDDVCFAPILNTGLFWARQRRGIPAQHQPARRIVLGSHGTQRVARFVAGATVRHALYEIGAAIPFSIVLSIRLVHTRREKQTTPDRQQPALIERKFEPMFAVG